MSRCLTKLAGRQPGGRWIHRCLVCGRECSFRSQAGGKMQCGVAPPVSGPGTELAGIFRELRIKPKPGCGCRTLMQQMNALAADGCRRERELLAAKLRSKRKLWGWTEQAAAALRAAASGLALQLNWADPFASIIDLAIERAS